MARRGGQDPRQLAEALRKQQKGLPPSSRAHECVKDANRASSSFERAMEAYAKLSTAQHQCKDHGDSSACKRLSSLSKDASEAAGKARIALADLTICVARRRQRRKR